MTSATPLIAIDVITRDVPILSDTATIADAHTLLECATRFNTINYLYLVDASQHLTGTLSIKDVFTHRKDTPIIHLMTKSPISVHEHTRQEKVARIALDNNLKAIPVITKEGVLVGVVPSDVILRILDQEMREDILRFGGHVRTRDSKVTTANETLLHAFLSRTPWLIIGMIGGTVIAIIIRHFEEAFEETVLIASFIPLVVYIGDAIGTQLNTLVIRDIATGKFPSLSLYIGKQTLISIAIGGALALSIEVLLYFIAIDTPLRHAVALGIFSTATSAVLTGILIPWAFNRLQIDPAAATGPVATIIQDMTSVIIFLSIAQLII